MDSWAPNICIPVGFALRSSGCSVGVSPELADAFGVEFVAAVSTGVECICANWLKSIPATVSTEKPN